MVKLKYVIVGAGATVLQMHHPALGQDFVDVVGLYDRQLERGQKIAQTYDCPAYDDLHEMLTAAQGDVAVVLTSHPSHRQLTVDCLEAGYHVLVEKPMAVQVRDADAMIAAAKQHNRQLGVCFQRRYMPSVLRAKQLIDEGHLGELQYIYQSVTWTRPRRYFEDRLWRGTWAGEGGGVLINQAAHNLDMLCFLVGMPTQLKAWTRTQLHDIETEDTAHAMLQWENGAMGFFHVSTAEAGPPNHLEIRGTKGYLTFTNYGMTYYELETDIRTYIETSTEPFAKLTGAFVELPPFEETGDHIALYRDFHEAVLNKSESLVYGESGRMSLELTNAMIYSGQTGKDVTLPLDRAAYAGLLAELMR